MACPLISVIITAYNYADLLPQALESALAQHYPNLEILVLDDASTDATPSVIERYLEDPRVRYHRHPINLGSHQNVNFGIRMARGEYINILSADNILDHQCVHLLYESLKDDPSLAMAYGRNLTQNLTTSRIDAWDYIPFAYRGRANEFANLLTTGCYISLDATLARRALYDELGLLDPTIGASDLEILVRWAAAGKRFAYVPEALCTTRVHSRQASAPERYIENGAIAHDFAAILERYLLPEFATRLHGYEWNIQKTLRCLEQTVTHHGYRDNGALATRVGTICDRLNEIQGIATYGTVAPAISFLLVGDESEDKLTATLLALEHLNGLVWESLVIEQASVMHDAFRSPRVAEFYARDPRIKPLYFIPSCTESQALHQSVKMAEHTCLIFLRVGTIVDENTLFEVYNQIRAEGIAAPRNGLYGISRSTLDSRGGFNTDSELGFESGWTEIRTQQHV